MEENITKQQTNILNITIITDAADKGLARRLSEFIAPDGKEAREFVFTVSDRASADAGKKEAADLVVILVENEEDTQAAKLAAWYNKKGIRCITSVVPESPEEISKTILLSLEKALDSGFTLDDFVQVYNRGTSVETIRRHLVIFRNGIAKVRLEKPATLTDGIYPLSPEKANEYATLFDGNKDNFKLKKFVPASGAASRMFKFACEFIAEFDPEKESINAYINRRKDTDLSVFLVGIDKLPFFKEVIAASKQNPDYEKWDKNLRYYNFIKTMLGSDFDFANKPKGILPFHQYKGFTATPVYEHLKESVAYASSQGQANVHFTISEEHIDGFLDSIGAVKEDIEKQSGIAINVSFSYQHKQTDTIATDVNNNPFRTDSGRLHFRPGGHGALIENLNRLDSDIIFIKNIDNVSHNNIKTIALYKKALGGILIELQQEIFGYLDNIENGETDDTGINKIFTFARERLSVEIPDEISKYTLEHKIEYARELLNRPIRVCGMVKNEGEPGGGPFWIKGDRGRLSLQIIESSQIDLDNQAQQDILSQSTHFNPVDLVCGLKNHKGERFDLNEFVDVSTGFIVYKTKYGKDLKGYELPGLWNGAMAGWTTVFVEVPLATFNPVKTVNDLLKPAHQPQ